MGINKIYFVESKSFNPYYNIALEKKLFDICKDDEMYFYLWQNDKTVVIGKNQSAYKECNLEAFKEDGGFLARRLSGGGAVYHDLGNLNFTFVTHKNNYMLNRQLVLIKSALNKLKVSAYFSGRNDILIADKKVCGNAYLLTDNICMHHGSILIDTDLNKLSSYLNVSKEKLVSKGVESVRSRVENIKSFSPSITVDLLKEALKDSIAEVYWIDYSFKDVEIDDYSFFSDKAWLYRKEVESNYKLIKRFDWGEIVIKFDLSDDIIKNLNIFTDAMSVDFVEKMENSLNGSKLSEIRKNISEIEHNEDIISLFNEVFNV